MHRPLLIIVLLAFGCLTAIALWHQGYWGIVLPHFQSWGAGQVLADLVIALGLILIWMWRDAQTHGRSFWPWLVLTLATGAFGPLIYLLWRPRPRPGE